jgi:hypothetical protein
VERRLWLGVKNLQRQKQSTVGSQNKKEQRPSVGLKLGVGFWPS